jgi:uncharacterized Zn-finger protein
MNPSEVVEVKADEETVGCDGGGGALGHPLIYLLFEGKDSVDCYYCGRRFARAGRRAGEAGVAA